MILYIKHISIEGPETLGEFFKRKGFKSKTIDLSRGHPFPENLDDIDAVVVLGGPMNVYEEDKYSYLKEENVFIQKVLRAGIPYLGICLGSQLLAKACGAKVKQAARQEIGFFPVELTREGKKDPLMRGLPQSFTVYQWHEDMFMLPKEGVHLISAHLCPFQAFKINENAYGLQFHVEITDKNIDQWCRKYMKKNFTIAEASRRQMIQEYKEKRDEFQKTAETIYENFLAVIAAREAVV